MKWPDMTARERRIAALAATVAFIFLVTSLLPVLSAWYRDREQRMDAFAADIDRERRLVAEEAQWARRQQEIEQRRSELQRQVFQETTAPLLSASIQRMVREHADAAGVSINATRLAESLESSGWLLVEQTVSFSLRDQNAMMAFLQGLEESGRRLRVSRFSMRSNRSQYSGDLTVVGFARTGQGNSEASDE